MAEWLARLTGAEEDLATLSEHFRSTNLNVRQDEDDYYYLRSPHLNSIADDEARRTCAFELINHINGAARLLLGGGYFPVEFEGFTRIEEDGQRIRTVESSVTALWDVRTHLRPVSPEELEHLVVLAGQDVKVADSLRFFLKGDWYSLYKAWEIAGDAAGEAANGKRGYHAIIKRRWANDTGQGRFTGTAQSREVLGDEARHASESEKYGPPNNPMTIDEAREFVRSVIEAWVQE